MYHETTYEELRRKRRRYLLIAVAIALVAVVVWRGYAFSQESTQEQASTSIRAAVMQAALQCCAVEGSYPTSIDHLRDHYGLVINDRDYQITYEWMGDNIPPSVVVTAL